MIPFVEFQNAQAAPAVPASSHNTLQPKLDGWRLAFYIDGPGQARYCTRTLKPQAGKLPHLEAELTAIFPPGTVLDGEVVAFAPDAQGRLVNDFKWVAQVMGSGDVMAARKQKVAGRPLQFVAFDVLYWAGQDVRGWSYLDRLSLIEDAFAGASHSMVIASVDATQANHDGLVARGFEGSVVKDLRSTYASGERGRGWFKIKHQPTVDAVIMGFEPGKGKYAGTIGAVVFGQFKDGVLVERGRCSGMDDATRFALGASQETFIGTVIEVAHMGITSGDKFRHPQFTRFRPDRLAASCDWRNS